MGTVCVLILQLLDRGGSKVLGQREGKQTLILFKGCFQDEDDPAPVCKNTTFTGYFVSSVRSSYSHPDLLLITTHFFRSHRSSTLDFHFLSHYSYIKAIMLYKSKTWQDSGILWHTLAYLGILWHTLAYSGIL